MSIFLLRTTGAPILQYMPGWIEKLYLFHALLSFSSSSLTCACLFSRIWYRADANASATAAALCLAGTCSKWISVQRQNFTSERKKEKMGWDVMFVFWFGYCGRYVHTSIVQCHPLTEYCYCFCPHGWLGAIGMHWWLASNLHLHSAFQIMIDSQSFCQIRRKHWNSCPICWLLTIWDVRSAVCDLLTATHHDLYAYRGSLQAYVSPALFRVCADRKISNTSSCIYFTKREHRFGLCILSFQFVSKSMLMRYIKINRFKCKQNNRYTYAKKNWNEHGLHHADTPYSHS